MRDFVALLPTFYLVDSVPFMVVFTLFFRWWDDTSSGGSFAGQMIGALAVAGFMRLLHSRPVALLGTWKISPVENAEALRNIVLAVLLAYPGIFWYGMVIHMSGMTPSSERFYVGKIVSLLIIELILVAVYAFEQKWRDLLPPQRPETPFESTPGSPVHIRGQAVLPEWLIWLGSILGVCILVDIFVNQPWLQALELGGLLIGSVTLFVVFNAFYISEVKAAYKDKIV